MKNKMKKIKENLAAHRIFLRNFLVIAFIMAVIFSGFTMYVYRNSRQIIEEEFLAASTQDTENIRTYVDNYFMDIRYIISTLAINDLVQMFFSSDSPDSIVDKYYTRMQDQIQAFQNGNQAIEAIYLYSEHSNMICTAVQQIQFDYFTDRYWLEQLDADEHGFSIFPYEMNHIFPYVICVVKQYTVNNRQAVIAVLVNPRKLSLLSELEKSSYQELYLVSDDSEILFRKKQQNFLEPLSVCDTLSSFDAGLAHQSLLHPGQSDPYTFTQLHSSEYDWTYVLVTHLQEYTLRLSANRALLLSLTCVFVLLGVFLAVFISMRSLKPIHEIRSFLDNPTAWLSASPDHDREIKYIAGRIAQYMQLNNQLAEELNTQLQTLNETHLLALQSQVNPHFLFNTLNMIHLLESDYLGYEHIVPQMTLNLANLLRYSLEPAEMVPLETELTYTDLYLSILNQRYGENLKVVKTISAEAIKAKVPKLFIQPVIENAVFHGFSKMHDCECQLSIACRLETLSAEEGDQKLVILEIRDNGIGIKEETLRQLRSLLEESTTPSGKNIGLRNVAQRMRLLYFDQAQITIQSVPGKGTCFTLTFPYLE